MSTKIGMMFTSGYTSGASPTIMTTQTSNTTQNSNTILSMTPQTTNTTDSMSQDKYELKRIALCMDLYGLMKAKPCGSCGGFG
tara:strand:- start:619 stop:867 length:249 start_codon:yes stop_codon:yes gene_type:complete